MFNTPIQLQISWYRLKLAPDSQARFRLIHWGHSDVLHEIAQQISDASCAFFDSHGSRLELLHPRISKYYVIFSPADFAAARTLYKSSGG